MTLDEKVINIIAEQLGRETAECKPEAAFIEDLGVDSLDLFELVMVMEDKFQVTISDEELKNIRTIQDIINFLKSQGVE